jgi:O-antigen/teichoic acid export membrane protein
MSAIARHLLRSTASNVVGQLAVLAVWFALTPFVVHQLGATSYGLWVLVASLIAWGNLLDLGVGAAVTKYVADLRARGRSDEESCLVATALRMYCALAMLVITASVPFAFAFPGLFRISPEQQSDARWVVLLTGVALALQLPATTAHAVLRGLQRFDLINFIAIAATLAQAAATVAVLLLGGGVVGLAAIAAPLTVLTQVPMLVVIRRVAPDLRFGLRGAQRRAVSTVVSFSASLVVINGAGVAKTKTDEIVIAGALPLASVAPYSIARRVSELPTLLTYQFVRVLFPLASELHGVGDTARLRALYIGGTRLTLALFVPLAIGLIVLADPFLTAWVGEGFAGDAHIAVILLAAGMLDIAMWPAASMLQGTNGHRPLALFGGASALLNLGLSVALVGSMGVTGVALGTLVAAGLEVLVVVPFAMRRYGVGARPMIWEALAPGLLPAVPAVAALFALRAALAPSSLAAVVLVGALGGLVYAVGYLSFSASAAERIALWRVALGTRELARARRAHAAE